MRAAIGWNGSAQAARAVTAVLPFLRLAERTTILSAGAVDNYASPGGLVAHLARHDVKAEAKEIEPRNMSIAEALLDQSRKLQANILVIGAYGHSRLQQIILGSVTKEILSTADLPVLMAH